MSHQPNPGGLDSGKNNLHKEETQQIRTIDIRSTSPDFISIQTTVVIMIIAKQAVVSIQENDLNSHAKHLVKRLASRQMLCQMTMKLLLDEYCFNYKHLPQYHRAYIWLAQPLLLVDRDRRRIVLWRRTQEYKKVSEENGGWRRWWLRGILV